MHPAVKYLPHVGVMGFIFHWFGWVEVLYEKTAWLRDLIHWGKKAKKKRHGKKK